jgi:hypothetical protein
MKWIKVRSQNGLDPSFLYRVSLNPSGPLPQGSPRREPRQAINAPTGKVHAADSPEGSTAADLGAANATTATEGVFEP